MNYQILILLNLRKKEKLKKLRKKKILMKLIIIKIIVEIKCFYL